MSSYAAAHAPQMVLENSGDALKRQGLPPIIDIDGAIFFAMMVPLLFVGQMGTYSALIFVSSVMAYALRHRGALVETLRSHGFVFLFPAYAVLSTFWSNAPLDTLKHSAEFFLTVVAAMFLIQARNRRAMLFALFSGFFLYAIASLVFGNIVAVGASGDTALSGLSESKNAQASIVVIGAMISLLWFFIGIKTKCYLQSMLAVCALMLDGYELLMAQSAGALAAFGVGVVTFLCKAGRRLRIALVGVGGVAALTSAMIFLLFTGPIVDVISNWFGKDVTLTGRTYLWARARDLTAEQPILGRGFAAFWQQGNLDAEGLWQFAGITSRAGFNFHNTSYDILVSMGWVGAFLFGLTLVIGLVRMASFYVRQPSLIGSFWLALGASMLVRMPIETMGTYEFSYDTILLFAMLGYATVEQMINARRVVGAS